MWVVPVTQLHELLLLHHALQPQLLCSLAKPLTFDRLPFLVVIAYPQMLPKVAFRVPQIRLCFRCQHGILPRFKARIRFFL